MAAQLKLCSYRANCSRFESVQYPFLPPANEVWSKVMFMHLCVILFEGVSVPACITGHMTRGVCPGGSLSRGSLSRGVLCQETPRTETLPPHGNGWVVRILLEYILVDVSVDAEAEADAGAWCEWRNWNQCFRSKRHFLKMVIIN